MGLWRRGKHNKRSGRGGGVDHNQAAIIKAFEKMGALVVRTDGVGNGMFDLIVGVFGELHLVEVKNPETGYGRQGLNKNQMDFAEKFKGASLHIVRTIDDAEALVSKWREDAIRATREPGWRPTYESLVPEKG